MCAPAGHVGLGLVEGAVGGGVGAREHEVLRIAAADVTAGALADVRRRRRRAGAGRRRRGAGAARQADALRAAQPQQLGLQELDVVLLPLQGLLRDSQLLPQRVQLVRLSNTNSCCHLRPESVMFHVCVRELAFGSQLLWCLLGQPAACLLAQMLVSRNSGHFLKIAHQQTNKDILLANGVGCVSLSDYAGDVLRHQDTVPSG